MTKVLYEPFVLGILCGGLGNQLFIIACTYAYSLKYDKQFYLSKTWEGITKNRPSYWDNLLNNLSIFTVDTKLLISKYIYNEPKFSVSEIPKEKNLILKGYFQSEKYFSNYKTEIKKLLVLTEELNLYAKNILKDIMTPVAVHIRRGDYKNLTDIHCIQNNNYYIKAKKYIDEKLCNKISYVYFSDDIEWVKNTFSLNENDIIINESIDYKEFAIMQQCHHFIIANSSFSWWAAWLSESDIDKIVIAPEKWFGSKGPQDYNDIYPDSWIKLSDD